MKKLLFWKKEKHYLNAEQTKCLLMYGFKNTTLQEVVDLEVDSLESAIKMKAGSGFRLTSKIYPTMKTEMVTEVKKHFDSLGFITDIYLNPDIPEFLVLIIGW